MRKLMPILAAAILLMAGKPGATQSSGGNFAITKHTIDSGGGQSVGGVFALTGIIGQPDAQPAASGGVYRLTGGYLTAGIQTPLPEAIFTDGFE